jgi:hypothetical protein
MVVDMWMRKMWSVDGKLHGCIRVGVAGLSFNAVKGRKGGRRVVEVRQAGRHRPYRQV